MFKYISLSEQVSTLKKENTRLTIETMQTKADLDFVAIMCDVELPEEEFENE